MRFKFYQLLDLAKFNSSFKVYLERSTDGNLIGEQNLPFELNNTDRVSIKVEQPKIVDNYIAHISCYSRDKKEEFIIIELDQSIANVYNKLFNKVELTPREKLLTLLRYYKYLEDETTAIAMLNRTEEIKMEILP